MIRPAWAEIDLACIRRNVREIRRGLKPQTQMMAVVKANGYGHGAAQVAATCRDYGVEWIGVAIVEEGIALRRAGIEGPILVLGLAPAAQAPLIVANGLTATVCTLEGARSLSAAALDLGTIAKVHVKVDTGMGRLGIRPQAAREFIKTLLELPNLEVEGIFTHFSTADAVDRSYFRQQLSKFTGVLAELQQEGISIPIVHGANSATVAVAPEAEFDLVRAGISLYGLQPAPDIVQLDLQPALSLKARVSYVHRVPAGTGISYGRRYMTERETTIATIPVGYADGYSRLLSNRAEVLVRGRRYRISGTICMDQCMIDVGDDPIEIGDEVVLIGRQGDEVISADELAGIMGTIHYEIVCLISERIPRIYLG
ncbi:MAG: alanine racemase [Firmicutes bacterium]|nr:alanine racemase [Bacillota bacterium]